MNKLKLLIPSTILMLGAITPIAGCSCSHHNPTPPVPPAETPLCFTVEGTDDGNFSHNNVDGLTIQYSLNDTSNWQTWDSNDPISVSPGNHLYVKNEKTSLSTETNQLTFSSNVDFTISGKLNSLIANSEVTNAYCFANLFYGCKNLIDASKLILPNNITDSCYENMFSGCSSLTTAPELPAQKVAPSCYKNMFYNCDHLATVPELKAEDLANECYYSMFENCSNIRITTMEQPEKKVFTCPEFGGAQDPVTNMFKGTSDWGEVDPVTGESYYWEVPHRNSLCFELDKIIGETEEDPALYYVFREDGSSLNVNIEFSYDEEKWFKWRPYIEHEQKILVGKKLYVRNTTNTLSTITDWITIKSNYDEDFNNFTVKASGNVNSMIGYSDELTENCYMALFMEFFNLTTAPELPSKKLADYCYQSMFSNCYRLNLPPKLPAEELKKGCYYGMFWACYDAFGVWEDEGDEKNKILTCPETIPEDAVTMMFFECNLHGSEEFEREGTPQAGHSYYWAKSSNPF